MSERFPGYDVLSKRRTPSWDEVTRRVVDRRLAIHPGPRFFSELSWPTLQAVCARILPQPGDRPPVPIAALVDAKLFNREQDGYRHAGLPEQGEAWLRGLAALRAEAQAQGGEFHTLAPPAQDSLLRAMQVGELKNPAWGGMDCALFFGQRLLPDIVRAYYAHPTAWSEIGFGGPASPRGYVRLKLDRRDPWEAAEAKPGREAWAREENRRVGRT